MHSLDLDVPQLHKKKAFPFFISFSSVKGPPPAFGTQQLSTIPVPLLYRRFKLKV